MIRPPRMPKPKPPPKIVLEDSQLVAMIAGQLFASQWPRTTTNPERLNYIGYAVIHAKEIVRQSYDQ